MPVDKLKSLSQEGVIVYDQEEIDGKFKELREKLDSMETQMLKLKDENLRLQRIVQEKPSFADLPVAPNLLKSSKNFLDYPQGLVTDSTNSGGVWSQFYYNIKLSKTIEKDVSSSISA